MTVRLCTRCEKRAPASDRHDLCGACRFYTRGPYKTEHMQQVSVRLPQALIDALHATAEREGRTLSDVIRAALRGTEAKSA